MAASPKFERSLQPTAETRPKLLYLYTSSRTKSIQSVLVIGGFTCVEIGKRLPVLHNVGAAAIFATFIPSALAYYKLLPPQIEKSVIEFTKYTNFLYLFIACIIVGSILGMDRQVLVKGVLKIFVPLAAGCPSPIYASLRVQIATAAAHHAVPVVYGERVMVDAGGLMSYGADTCRSAAEQVLACHQSSNRKAARHHHTARPAYPRRRGHRIRSGESLLLAHSGGSQQRNRMPAMEGKADGQGTRSGPPDLTPSTRPT
jgi:hypothetical protein